MGEIIRFKLGVKERGSYGYDERGDAADEVELVEGEREESEVGRG